MSIKNNDGLTELTSGAFSGLFLEATARRKPCTLYITKNQALSTFKAGTFAGMHLTRFEISENGLIEIESGAFSGLVLSGINTIANLKIHGNQKLRKLARGSFRGLIDTGGPQVTNSQLDIASNNLLTDLESGVFDKLEVDQLIISGNDGLAELGMGAFAGVKTKKIIIEANSNLSRIHRHAFATALYSTGNPLPPSQIRVSSAALECCGLEWLIYGPSRIDKNSELGCSSPPLLATSWFKGLLGSTPGVWDYDNENQPPICVACDPGTFRKGQKCVADCGPNFASRAAGNGSVPTGGECDHCTYPIQSPRRAASSNLQLDQHRPPIRDLACSVCEYSPNPKFVADPDVCIECKPGYFMNPAHGCVLDCTKDTLNQTLSELVYAPAANSTSQCERCTDIENCVDCSTNASVCTICDNYRFATPGGKCARNCDYERDQLGQPLIAESGRDGNFEIGARCVPQSFILVTTPDRLRTGPKLTEPRNMTIYLVGETYRISRRRLSHSGTIPSAGTIGEIRYKLDKRAPSGWFVNVVTGEIIGSFGTPGKVTFAIIAVDANSKTALLEELQFVVVYPPDFVLKTSPEHRRMVDSSKAIAPSLLPASVRVGSELDSGDQLYNYSVTSNTIFQISPLLVLNGTTVTKGSIFDITYKLSNHVPATVYVQPATGMVLGRFAEPGIVNFDLIAVDAGEQTAMAERMRFHVLNPAQFSTTAAWQSEAPSMTNGVRGVYIAGTSYSIPGPGMRKSIMFSNANNDEPERVTYKLVFPAGSPQNFLVDTKSGKMLFTATTQDVLSTDKQYTVELVAVDTAGSAVTVKLWKFVVQSVEFRIGSSWNPDNDMIEGFLPTYNLSQAYAIPGPAVTPSTLFEGLQGKEKVTYSLEVSRLVEDATLQATPGTYFVVSRTGQMSIETVEPGEYKLVLTAQNKLGARVTVKSATFKVLPTDTADPVNGPNRQGCGPGVAVDQVEFDHSFSCNCEATRFEGANCATAIVPVAETSTNNDTTTSIIVGAVLGAIVMALVLVAAALRYRSYKALMRVVNFEQELRMLKDSGELEADRAAIPREIKRGHVTMISKIGSGAFGEVWKAMLDESSLPGGVPSHTVAVKTSKESHGKGADELVREATMMAQVTGHPNLVALIGVVTSGAPLLLLLSLCENGSLLSYLRNCKVGGKALPPSDRIKFALEIARGMHHLADHNFVHRDLAARNVLVDSIFTCKVADFGLSRTAAIGSEGSGAEYYRSSHGTFPIRWTSPEAMTTLKFSTASDIWSFGITLIEIYTDGARPYPALSNDQIISAVNYGVRCRRPALCSETLYALLTRCWSDLPAARPGFAEIISELDHLHCDQSSATVPPEDIGAVTGARQRAATYDMPTYVRARHDIDSEGYLRPVTHLPGSTAQLDYSDNGAGEHASPGGRMVDHDGYVAVHDNVEARARMTESRGALSLGPDGYVAGHESPVVHPQSAETNVDLVHAAAEFEVRSMDATA